MFLLTAPASDYGLFLSDEDPRKGIWLESGRTLDYYMLRNGVNDYTQFNPRYIPSVVSVTCRFIALNAAKLF